MNAEQWQQLKDILHRAMEMPRSDRDAYLGHVCAGDESSRQEIESLLAAYEEANSALEFPAFAVAAQLLAEDADDAMVGRRIGPYQVRRRIGEGGMGAVYLAERADDQYHKRVAIKLIKRGMDTDFVLRRFRYERQILANLDHPNIARLLDGGATAEGLPFLVMESIEGVPITEYCDAKRFTIHERLSLFRQVLAAVHYAHQNLVVHRDLKPSNILVTAEGSPKLLDFGIAKLLNPELASEAVDATGTAMRLMTPDFASPEQIRGDAITTATDIYSLGILLYELLTGRRPFELKGLPISQIETVISEQDPEPPSMKVAADENEPGQAELVSRNRSTRPEKLRRLLTGDLDMIVLKALHKEPRRRYSSVDQFAEDLRRYLEGLPIIARKDTFRYRAVKFVRRNKAAVLAATAVAVSLIGGIAATAWQARVANAERSKAERRFDDVRKLANSFIFEIHDSIVTLPGATPARELVVKRGLEYLDKLAREAEGNAALEVELANAYHRIGMVQGDPYHSNLGDTEGALRSLRKAASLFEHAAAADPRDSRIRSEIADTSSLIANILWSRGETEEALALYRKAADTHQSLLEVNPSSSLTREKVASTRYFIGQVLVKKGDYAGAMATFRTALKTYEQILSSNAGDDAALIGTAVSHLKIGQMLLNLESVGEALASYQRGIAILQKVVAKNPDDAHSRRVMALGLCHLAQAQLRNNDPQGALGSSRRAMVIQKELSADPRDARMRIDRALGYSFYGRALLQSGDVSGALPFFRQGIDLLEAAAAADPTDTDFLPDLADLYEARGAAYQQLALREKTSVRRRQHWREAEEAYRRSLETYLNLRSRGALPKIASGKPEEISRLIARTEEELTAIAP